MTEVEKVLIPIIRNVMPQTIAEDIVGVQPMTNSVSEVFAVRPVTWIINCYGDMIHSFIYGHQWFNGEDWICVDGPFCHIEYKDDTRTSDSGRTIMKVDDNESN